MSRFLSSSTFKTLGSLQKRAFVVRANVGSDFDLASWTFEKDVLYQQAAANITNRRREQFESQPNSYVLSFLSSLSKNKDQLHEELILSITDSRRSNLGKSYSKLDLESPCVQLRNHISNYLTQLSRGAIQLQGLNSKSSPLLTDKEFTKPLSKDLQQRFADSQLHQVESEIAKRLAAYRDGPAPTSSAAPEVQRLASSLLADEKSAATFLQGLQQYLETGHYSDSPSWAQISDVLGQARNVLSALMKERAVESPKGLTTEQFVAKVFPSGTTEWDFLGNWEEARQELLDNAFDFPFVEELERRLAQQLYPALFSILTSLESSVATRHQVSPATASPVQRQEVDRLQDVSRALVEHEINTITGILDLSLIRENVPSWKGLSNVDILHQLNTYRTWLQVSSYAVEDEYNAIFSKDHQKQLQQQTADAPTKRVATFQKFCQDNNVPATSVPQFLRYFLLKQNQEAVAALQDYNINLPIEGAQTHLIRRALNLTLSNANRSDVTDVLKANIQATLGADSAKEFAQWVQARQALVQQEVLPSLKEFASLEAEELNRTLKDSVLPFVKLTFDEKEFVQGFVYSHSKKPGFLPYSHALRTIKQHPLTPLEPLTTKEELYEDASSRVDIFAEQHPSEKLAESEQKLRNDKLE